MRPGLQSDGVGCGMKSLLIGILLLSSAVLAQETIPAGTVLAVQLNTSLDSRKCRPVQMVKARLMQDVPLPDGGKIPEGAKVIGHVVEVVPTTAEGGARVSLRFDRVAFAGRSLSVVTHLRALASMREVEYAQIPPMGTDRGSPWPWMNTNQIGGDAVYGFGGPVIQGSEVVGEGAIGGVLARLRPNPAAGCRGAAGDDDRLQALWLFSADACGTYGFPDLKIAHAGRTSPGGQIVLASRQGPLRVSGGSGLLLRVNAP